MTEASGTNRGGTADGSEPAVANEVHDTTYLVQGTRCFNEVLPPPVTAKAANEGRTICGEVGDGESAIEGAMHGIAISLVVPLHDRMQMSLSRTRAHTHTNGRLYLLKSRYLF